MTEEELVKKINFLSKKSKEEGLNDIEKQEQNDLRRMYVDRFKKNIRQHLEHMKKEEN